LEASRGRLTSTQTLVCMSTQSTRGYRVVFAWVALSRRENTCKCIFSTRTWGICRYCHHERFYSWCCLRLVVIIGCGVAGSVWNSKKESQWIL
jgi:hypothetical protein